MRYLILALLILPLAGCGGLLDLACALRAPSSVEQQGDAIKPKVP